MGKLCNLMTESAALIRPELPPAAVEALVENSLFWCTLRAIVILEPRDSALVVQAFDSKMEVATSAAAAFGSGNAPAEICAPVMTLLEATERSTMPSTRKASPAGTCEASLRRGIDIGSFSHPTAS